MSAADAATQAGPQLRDIHLPADPSWWPPAPGWWLLAAVGVAVFAFGLRRFLRWRRDRRWRLRVQAELGRIAASHAAQADAGLLVAEVSTLLRRASMLVTPHAAALRDDAWLQFLDAQLPATTTGESPFTTGPGRALIDTPYRRVGDPAVQAVEASALIELARRWLDAVLSRRHDRA